MTKIAILVGSLRANSLNKKLATELEKLAPQDTEFIHLEIAELPLFNQELEADAPASVKKLKSDIETADGVLVITPEYNRGITPVAKNAIDWASRPYGANSFAKKPVAVTGATGSPWGTVAAQTQARSVFLYLDTILMGQPELYIGMYNPLHNEEGIMSDHVRERLTDFITSFVAHVDKHK
jgi:chromate reductase